jgi:hypothetical protein
MALTSNTITIETFNSECPICLDGYESGIFRLKCKHSICQVCFQGLLKQENYKIKKIKCPLCREKIIDKSLLELLKEKNDDEICDIYYRIDTKTYIDDDEKIEEDIECYRYVVNRFYDIREDFWIKQERLLKESELEDMKIESEFLRNMDFRSISSIFVSEGDKTRLLSLYDKYIRMKERKGFKILRDNLRIPMLYGKTLRYNTFGYKIIQALVDAENYKMEINELIRLIKEVKNVKHKQKVVVLNNLKDLGYISMVSERGDNGKLYVREVQLSEEYVDNEL